MPVIISRVFPSSLLLLLLLVAGSIAALPAGSRSAVNTRQIQLEYLGTNDGLSQGMISAMVQDSDGYIWICTKDGLNRYDGYTFKVYRHQLSDSTSIASNYITSLYLDEANNLWIGTESKGVDLFDRATETFIHMEPSVRVSGALRGRSVSGGIWGDHHGHVMIPMDEVSGLDVITTVHPTGTRGRDTYTIGNIDKLYPVFKASSRDRHLSNSFYSKGGMWYYTDSLVYYPNEVLMKGGKPFVYSFGGANRCGGAWFLVADPQQEQIYMPWYDKLYKFNDTERKFKLIASLPVGYEFGCRSMVDRLGRIWSTQSDSSFLRIDIKTGAMERLTPVASASVIKHITASGFMVQDKDDNIWIGHPGMGIMKISTSADLFKRMPEIALTPSGGGTMWPYRTAKPGIKADLDTGSYITWKAIVSKLPVARETQMGPDASMILARDAEGAFWAESFMPSGQAHLIKIDPVKEAFEVISLYTGDGNNWQYLPIIPDNKQGIWYSERAIKDSAHLYHIRRGDHVREAYTFPVKNELGASRFISDWYEETDGTFWFATRMGVFSFRPDKNQWRHYANEANNQHSLSFNQTLSICPDPAEPARYMWVGTEGGGLNKLDRATGYCTAYTVEDGLPNNVIYAVQSDKHNNLWMSTNNGLCLFDTRSLQIRNFSASDGLPGNEFNRFQFSKSATGVLCFGGIEGSVYFDPDDFYKKKSPAKIVFTQLKLFNKPVTKEGTTGNTISYKLPCPIEQAKELVFAYDQHMISFVFALLDLSNPGKNKYRYKLEGLNDEWIDNGYNHEVTLTNLAPGTYTLRVSGHNGNGIWTAQDAVMHITIQHPWWASWWFRSLMAVILFSILYSLYRYRLTQALHMERVRNRIAQDLHDEIGSTLSSISLYSAVMQKLSPDMSKDTGAILTKIRQSTSQMMESMNDIVWTIKADNDSFEQVVNRMRAFAVNMTEAKGITLHFDADVVAEKLKMNMDQRKNIYLIFKEAVNNAIKYAECKNLHVHISLDKGKLEMTIADDGAGFDEITVLKDSTLPGGNGLRSMHLRAKDIGGILSIDSTKRKGTRIILTLSV